MIEFEDLSWEDRLLVEYERERLYAEDAAFEDLRFRQMLAEEAEAALFPGSDG
jgi:hypothetical protein